MATRRARDRLPVAAVVASLFLIAVATRAADPAAPPGRDIAANCANCHGTNGRSLPPMPSLAGRPAGEIAMLVREFRDGKRPSTVMQQLAKGYTDAQIEAAATYFAEQPR